MCKMALFSSNIYIRNFAMKHSNNGCRALDNLLRRVYISLVEDRCR
jgi:hypothetical protein